LDGLCAVTLTELRRRGSKSWAHLEVIFRLLASADEACQGLGRVTNARDVGVLFAAAANSRLSSHGTLSRFHPERVRVLPKVHTPQVGITLRSLSRHVAFLRSPVGVKWHIAQRLGSRDDARLNLLLVPWPLEVNASAFSLAAQAQESQHRRVGYFDFRPSYPPPEQVVDECVDAARKLCSNQVHGVILPESALTLEEAENVAKRLWTRDVQFMLTGVRAERQNMARMMVRVADKTETFDQYKHHRWCIDSRQIKQYNLEWKLSPDRLWWENVDIDERQLNLVSSQEWLCICHLICEDLARLEPVTPCIRAVGPNLVIALLQDGPQLEKRWPGRYASVLADDPGCSVLTLTSLGMALLSRPPGVAECRAVALWKDRVNGTQELHVPPGSRAILLTLTARYSEEFTVDGRSDDGASASLVLTGFKPIPCPGPT
jgi:hypothetical protein